MESNVKVSFWLNRSKKDSKGLVPVYLRVAYNSLRLHKSTGVHIKTEDWDARNKRVKGSTPEVFTINSQLDALNFFISWLCWPSLYQERI